MRHPAELKSFWGIYFNNKILVMRFANHELQEIVQYSVIGYDGADHKMHHSNVKVIIIFLN